LSEKDLYLAIVVVRGTKSSRLSMDTYQLPFHANCHVHCQVLSPCALPCTLPYTVYHVPCHT